jgi:hypothetical protein
MRRRVTSATTFQPLRLTLTDKEAMNLPGMLGASGTGVGPAGEAGGRSAPSEYVSMLRDQEAIVTPEVSGPVTTEADSAEEADIGFKLKVTVAVECQFFVE